MTKKILLWADRNRILTAIIGLSIFVIAAILTGENEVKFEKFEVGIVCSDMHMYTYQIEVAEGTVTLVEMQMIKQRFKNEIHCPTFVSQPDKLRYVRQWFENRYQDKFKVK